jgi:far upstream element-binding protein
MVEELDDAATKKRVREDVEEDNPSKLVKVSSECEAKNDKEDTNTCSNEGENDSASPVPTGTSTASTTTTNTCTEEAEEEQENVFVLDRSGADPSEATSTEKDNPGNTAFENAAESKDSHSSPLPAVENSHNSNPSSHSDNPDNNHNNASSNPTTHNNGNGNTASNPNSQNPNPPTPDQQQQISQVATTGNPTTTTAVATTLPEPTIIEEKDHVSAAYVGRVIGKGGEMIRDLQARAGCRVDVDQNVPEGAPRVITYRGTRAKVDFAKRLVKMLCEEGRRDVDLPLGEASQKHILVPANVIGKIIGRGGEMIRELQNKSQAKIQVHHTASSDMDPNQRKVTVTGTPISVTKAEEMIHFLTTNPAMDAMSALTLLIADKAEGRSQWGSGPPYPSMPNGGIGMQGSSYASSGYAQQQQQQYGGYYGQQQQPVYGSATAYGQAAVTQGGGYYGQASAMYPSGGDECEVVPCPRMYMGRVIGSKGSTINDLQKRSGCDIQINQDVPPGQDCQITIKGSRQGIELAKQMLTEVIELGPAHSYAGGMGSRQQQMYGGGQQQQQYGVLPQQQGAMAYQQGAAVNYAQHYQQYQQQAYGQQAAVVYGQQQQQQYPSTAPAAAATYGAYPAVVAYPPAVVVQESPWKSATASDGQIYYYNEKTGESQWEKPPGMP